MGVGSGCRTTCCHGFSWRTTLTHIIGSTVAPYGRGCTNSRSRPSTGGRGRPASATPVASPLFAPWPAYPDGAELARVKVQDQAREPEGGGKPPWRAASRPGGRQAALEGGKP